MHNSVTYGLKVSAIRNTMISGVFAGGVGLYVFYALQPHLLDLWGNPRGVRDRRSGGRDHLGRA